MSTPKPSMIIHNEKDVQTFPFDGKVQTQATQANSNAKS